MASPPEPESEEGGRIPGQAGSRGRALLGGIERFVKTRVWFGWTGSADPRGGGNSGDAPGDEVGAGGGKASKGGKGGKPAPSAPDSYGLGAAFDPAVLAQRPSVRQLNRWKQGDLLRGIPLGWVADTNLDPLTNYDLSDLADPGDPANMGDPTPAAEHADLVGPVDGSADTAGSRMALMTWSELNANGHLAMSETGWGVVISQTCDIVAKGPGERHGTVQVAPVVLGTGRMPQGRVDDAKLGRVVELVHVPALTGIAGGGDWFADLRMSVPVSKGVLLNRDPIEGFDSQARRLELAEAVASKYRRPATHDAVADYLIPELSKLVAEAAENGAAWPESIEQIRLLVRDGDRLEPKKVQLLVISHTRLSAEDRKPLRNFRDKRRKEFKNRTTAKPAVGPTEKNPARTPEVPGVVGGCDLVQCRFESKHKLSITEYRDSVPLDISGLDGSYW